jgi:tetratricopeptide (TPR) repeat protein
MINLLLALAAGGLVFAAIIPFFPWYAAFIPGLIVALGAYVVLGQRTMKQLEAISERAQKEMMAQRIDKAIETFKSGFPLGKRQFLVGSLLHANLGMLLYVKQDFEGAKPHLEQGFARNYLAKAMLGAYYFRTKDYARSREAFEVAVKHGKKDGLVWSTYAYCLWRQGDRDGAMKVLGRAVEKNPADEKLKSNLKALQNNKPMKMRLYAPQFYQFHLERPPPELAGGGRRVIWERR